MPKRKEPPIHFQFISGNSRVHNGHTYAGPSAEHGSSKQSSQSDAIKARNERAWEALLFDQLDARRQNLRQPSPNTCRWILDTEEYRAWISPEEFHAHHGFFWIKGKPGVGKSILMNYLVAVSTDSMPDARAISFFFNARGHELERTVLGLYRALLSQLMARYEDLKHVFSELGFVDPDLIQRNGWQEQGLKNLLSHAISKLQLRRLVCYIDALDECPEDQMRDMVQFFQEIGVAAIGRGSLLNICFSSRHYPNITIKKGISLAIEGQTGHLNDLERFVDSTLTIDPPEISQDIKSQILQKANGVFLWVVLVVPMLNKIFDSGRMAALNEQLQRLPSKLSLLFHDMLIRDAEDREAALLCIQLVLFARRPLHPRELYFAINVGLDRHVPRATSISKEEIYRYILSTSKGLVEKVRDDHRYSIQFIHESVRDFFLHQEDGLQHVLQQLWPHLGTNFIGKSQDVVKEVCLRQICAATNPQGGYPDWNSPPKHGRNRLHPFLLYAVSNVLPHSNEAQSYGIQQWDWLRKFPLICWKDFCNKFASKGLPMKQHGNGSLLYVVASQNLIHLVRHSPDRMGHLDIKGGSYGTPLVAALVEGHREVARYLGLQVFLDQGLDISTDQQDERFFAQLRRLKYIWPLQKNTFINLSMLGCASAMKAMWLRGEDVNQLDVNGHSPLFHAATHGSVDVVRWLCSLEDVDPNITDFKGSTILTSLCQFGSRRYIPQNMEHFVEICHILLSHPRIRPDQPDGSGRTPFSYAVGNCHLNIAQILWSTRSVDPNSRCSWGRTPLTYAVLGGKEIMVDWFLMLDSIELNEDTSRCVTPTTIQSVDIDGRTPLSHAAEVGRPMVIRKLLETNEVDVNSEDASGRTPLSYAAESCRWENVEALLASREVDVNCLDIEGWSPLRWALSSTELDEPCYLPTVPTVLKLLRKGQADVDSVAKDGLTPLTYAKLMLIDQSRWWLRFEEDEIKSCIEAMERYKRGESLEGFPTKI
ncbi:ankyrin repeat-containing domain protein [Hypomontagnella monticulosa]|nr:ankyrin repeat-containing domain protein [Hypomontagnella monticulosa]